VRRLAVVAVLAAVPVATSLASGRAARVPIVRATTAQQALMAAVLNAVEPTELTRVEFVPQPRSLLRFTAPQYTVRSNWEGELSAAAYAVRARPRRIPVPREVVVQGRSGGVGVDIRLLTSGVVRRRPTPAAVEAFAHSVASILTSAHSRVVETRVLRPSMVALAITARVDRPAAFLHSRSERIIALSSQAPTGLYSVYIGLEDRHGATFFAVGGPSVGGDYVRPGLAGCTSLPTHALGQSPPSCPA
jgi:hypothetical protein